jgi:hypothetical protein
MSKPAQAAVLTALKEEVVKRKKGKGRKERSAGAPSPESQRKKVTRASTRKITAKLESDSSRDEIGLEVKKEILDRGVEKAKVKPSNASFVTKLVK